MSSSAQAGGLPAAPRYGSRSIAEVLPSAAAALGAPGFDNALHLPEASRVVVALVDGLGSGILKRYAAHTPFLRQVTSAGQGSTPVVIDAAFPSTTAASLASLGTGLPPGQHGMVGYDVRDPASGRVVNQLGNWDPAIDPRVWQPFPTVFERLEQHTDVTTVSLPRFETSGTTRAALRGGRFRGAKSLAGRVTAAVEALKTPGLVYFYVNELDKAAHAHGVDSHDFLAVLEDIDHTLKTLAARLPRDTVILITGDHGLVDVPASQRLDLGEHPELLDGVETTAGEPRMVQLFLKDVAQAAKVAERWSTRFGERIWALTREEAINQGLLGDVSPGVRERVGHVLILSRAELCFFDTTRVRPESMHMVAQHGSLTKAEREVPLLVTRATGPKAGRVR